MQYYRIWIYSCNWALGITSAIFTVFSAFVLADVRFSLLRGVGVELYHPTFIYACTALLIQCGVIQTVGCVGAQRLNRKLLSIYWIILLLLTIGDVVVGLVWVFKLENVKHALRPTLTREFITKYGTDNDLTKTWNGVQTQEHCCGVNGPLDFGKLSTEVRMQILQEQNIGRTESAMYLLLPESCCTKIETVPISTPTQDYDFGPFSPLNLEKNSQEHDPAGRQHSGRRRRFVHHRKKSPSLAQGSGSLNVSLTELDSSLGKVEPEDHKTTEEPLQVTEISIPFTCQNPEMHTLIQLGRNTQDNPGDDVDDQMSNGCGIKLIQWLDHIRDVLFISGFCVVGFIKAFFLIILRYEIREMIKKIHTMERTEEINCSTPPSRPETVNMTLLETTQKSEDKSAFGRDSEPISLRPDEVGKHISEI